MDDYRKRIQREVDENYDFFQSEIHKIAISHMGQYALIRNKEIVDYFDTLKDAEKYARAAFGDRMYSIQKVDDAPAELGFIGEMIYA